MRNQQATTGGEQATREQRRFSHAELAEAANRARDDILAAIEADDQGDTDVVNLVVNAYYLEHPTATLDDAINACYSESPATVLGWTRA